MRRNVKVHKRQGRDKDVVSNPYITNYASIAAYPYIIANNRIAFSGASEFHPDRYTMVHGTIPANDGSIVYSYVSTVDEDQSLADPGVPPYLYPGFEGAASEHPSCQEWMTPALIQPE